MSDPRRPWEREDDRLFGLRGAQLNLAVFTVLGAGIAAAGAWLFAFGGAEEVGLREEQAATRPVSTTLVSTSYESASCMFEVPEGRTVECGYLTVPENRKAPNGRAVRLPVAVFRTANAEKATDPIIYLDGGPGAKTLEYAPLVFDVLVAPLLGNRDVILFDQRGAGYSEPSLDCPEMTDLTYDSLEFGFTIDDSVAYFSAAANRCRERLARQGVDPSLANSAENAADVNDLRLALGYGQWNLYGISYGTKLALTVMRDHPEGVRSVVLDSTYPLQVDAYAEMPANFDRALRVLFDSCAADASCSATYPGLEAAFYETVRKLNETPLVVPRDPLSTRPVKGAVISGNLFASFVFSALYSEEIFTIVPEAVFETRDGEYDLLLLLVDFYLLGEESVSPGMFLSVQCSEELPFVNGEALIAAGASHPQLGSFHELEAKSITANCNAWRAEAAAPVENARVKSEIPTLVMAGQFDPITPPDWGRLVVGDLSHSFFFEFPGVGHGVSVGDDCPAGIMRAFLSAPGAELDASCIAGMGAPEWLVE